MRDAVADDDVGEIEPVGVDAEADASDVAAAINAAVIAATLSGVVASVDGDGTITGVTVTNGGKDYITAPTLAVTTDGGTGAALTGIHRQQLAAAGFRVETVDLDAIEAGGGSLRCCIGEIY